jgi:tetratricopeptide (TPR) repeat protein
VFDIVRNQFGVARTNLEVARAIYEQRTPTDPERLPVALHWLGFASYQRQDFDQARKELEQSINLLKPENKRNTRYLLGKVERASARYDRAKVILESVLQEDQHAPNKDSAAIAVDLLELTAISRLSGDREAADRFLASAETTFESLSPSQGLARWARLAHEKGMAALAGGKIKQAEQLIRESIAKGQNDPEMDMVMWTGFMDDYAKVLRQRGRNEEAKQIEQQARQIRDTLKK